MTFCPKMLKFLHPFTMTEKKVSCKRNTSLMLLLIIHIEQCTNKISVFSDVMLYGLAESSLLPPSSG